MSYFQKCEILKENTVFDAHHFQYWFNVFFTGILMGSDPLGEINNYAVKVECQFRGSPNIHYFLWILNSVKLSEETIEEYVVFLDQTIHSFCQIRPLTKTSKKC